MSEKLSIQGDGTYVVSSKNKKIGLALLIGPFAGLVAVFVIYAIAAFVIAQSAGGEGETRTGIMSLVNVLLGFIGMLCIIGLIVGIPLGIIFLNKKELISGKFDERSGKGKDSIIPEEIKGWNWGAAGLSFIWGVWHGVWISLLIFIPIVNIVITILLGFKGNEWAWRAQKWESVEKFKVSQNKWLPWGIIFFILSILGFISQLSKL